jgi:hypothetical protein
VKTLIRALVLIGVAVGGSFALARVASADVVEPRSAYQPASVALLSEDAAAAALPAAEAEPQAVKEERPAPSKATVATPAPEPQVVRQRPVPAAEAHTAQPPSVARRLIDPFRVGFEHIGASLGRVASACDVGLATGPGGPGLVLAVLSIAFPFVGRRFSRNRRVADEDVPELLYAWKLTPPG